MSFAEPNALPSLISQARLAQQAGRTAEAQRLFASAVRQSPRNAALLLEAGVLEASIGNHKAAERLLDRALKLDPANADIHYNLGQIAREGEHLEKAIRLFRKTLALDPRYGDAVFALGEALYAQGRAEEALPLLEQAISIDPRDVEATHVRALALDHLGRKSEAIKAYKETLRLSPLHVNARLNLAQLAAQSMEALEAQRLVLELDITRDAAPEHFALIAQIMNLIGNDKQAVEFAQKAITTGHDELAVASTEANIHIDSGDFDAAEAALRKMLALNPRSIHSYYRLGVIKKLEPQAEPTLRRAADDERLSAEDRANACFALFYLLDKARQHEEAFGMLDRANGLRRREAPYDIRRHLAQVDRVIATYTPEFIASRREHGFDGKGAIFVGGMPRSGTTLTEQILSAHPLVHGGGESLDVARVVRHVSSWPEGVHDLAPGDIQAQGETIHRNTFTQAGDKPFATDKTPANFTFFGAIACALPNAKLVYVRREPGDNAMSLYEQNFLRGLGYSYDLEAIGAVYRAHLRLMRHWIETCGLPIHTVEYDSLVSNPEPHIRMLMEFAGPGFVPECLAPDRVDRPVRTSSVWQVRQPINAKSVGRWQRYEKQMEPFFRALEGES